MNICAMYSSPDNVISASVENAVLICTWSCVMENIGIRPFSCVTIYVKTPASVLHIE